MRSPWNKVFVGLAWVYLVLLGIQAFTAGMGLLGGENMDLHEGFGYSVVHLSPILILIIAFVAKMPRPILIMQAVLTVIIFLQPIWAAEFNGEILGALH